MVILLQILIGTLCAVASNQVDVTPSELLNVTLTQECDADHGLSLLQKRAGSNNRLAANQTVRIVHISDTHNLHRSIGHLPLGDILIHTGDFSNHGNDDELNDTNGWFGELKSQYQHILIVPGNHDWTATQDKVNAKQLTTDEANSPRYLQAKIPNAKVLNHELLEVMGLRIFGTGWCVDYDLNSADVKGTSYYDKIPASVDVLLTHDPPFGIFDMTLFGHFGSSQKLVQAIQSSKPKVHLFGHVHEQRGQFQKANDGHFVGGVEYLPNPSVNQPFKQMAALPSDFPVEVVSNNAMANTPYVDNVVGGMGKNLQHITGTARLVIGNWDGTAWHFTAHST